jgi:hypothetical protein
MYDGLSISRSILNVGWERRYGWKTLSSISYSPLEAERATSPGFRHGKQTEASGGIEGSILIAFSRRVENARI